MTSPHSSAAGRPLKAVVSARSIAPGGLLSVSLAQPFTADDTIAVAKPAMARLWSVSCPNVVDTEVPRLASGINHGSCVSHEERSRVDELGREVIERDDTAGGGSGGSSLGILFAYYEFICLISYGYDMAAIRFCFFYMPTIS